MNIYDLTLIAIYDWIYNKLGTGVVV